MLIKHSMISNLELPGRLEKVQALSSALHDLPASHYETLKYLLGHLYRYVPCYESEAVWASGWGIGFVIQRSFNLSQGEFVSGSVQFTGTILNTCFICLNVPSKYLNSSA